jgi:hypothetical protein
MRGSHLNPAERALRVAGIDFQIAQQMLGGAAAVKVGADHAADLGDPFADVAATVDRGAVG